MSSVEYLREFVNERLTAAAEEIFRVFIKTIVEYEEEIDRQRRLLDTVLTPEVKLHRIELPQQHVCKEEEVLADQQLCIQERNSSLDQEDPEPPQIKEEQEELCSSQEGEQLELKQETDAFMWTPTYEESDHSEPEPDTDHQLLSHNSHEAESQHQDGGEHGDSGSARYVETEPKRRWHKSNSNHVNNSTMSEIHCNIHTKSLKCDTCGKLFKFKPELQAHMRIHTGERPYSCQTCGKDFPFSSGLWLHMRTHTCGRTFIRNRDLKIHTGEKPYLCKTCGKRFCLMSILKRHMIIHTDEKPHTCQTCGKSFSDISALRSHEKIHTGEKPHTCKTCGKAFRRNSDLKVHIRTHTGERPYTCKPCGRAFKSNSNLKNHMRTHR